MKRLRQYLIHWLARRLLPLVEAKDVIMFNKGGQMFIDGEQISAAEVQNLRAEVRFLEECRTWQLMNKYFESLAQKKMFTEATTIESILFAKSILYTLEVQRTIIKNIKNLK